MKLGNIEALYNTLSSLKEKEMPIRLSYKFTLLLDKIDCDYNFFISEMRKIINKYGLKDDKGELVQENGNIKINPDSFALAEPKFNNLKIRPLLTSSLFLCPKIKYLIPSLKYPIFYQIFGEFLPKNYL